MTESRRARAARHDWLEIHAHALTVPCRDCKAIEDEPCHNAVTGDPLDGPPAHISRICDADRKLAGELDDRRSRGRT